MMETIASWIASVIGEMLNLVVSCFMNLMTVDLGTLAGFFPAFITGYHIFQSLGMGLIICIAIYQLMKFFGGALVEVQDTPVRILVRAFIAGMLLWFGGYLLDMVVELAALPYQAFVNMPDNIAGTHLLPDLDEFTLESLFFDIPATIFSASTVICVYIFVAIIIAWNLMKLMIEVLERYLMVGVLAYTSPLAFSTLTSQATSNIFRSWFNMFLGQCALLSISAWMLKLCISGFTFSEGTQGVAIRLLLTLALCKIAQRADTYLQQLGIGVATTGGNLLDEAIGSAMMIGNAMGFNDKSGAGRGERADKNAVLGDKARTWAQPQAFGTIGGLKNVASGFKEKMDNYNKEKASGDPHKFAKAGGNLESFGGKFKEAVQDAATGAKNIHDNYKKGYEKAPEDAANIFKHATEAFFPGSSNSNNENKEADDSTTPPSGTTDEAASTTAEGTTTGPDMSSSESGATADGTAQENAPETTQNDGTTFVNVPGGSDTGESEFGDATGEGVPTTTGDEAVGGNGQETETVDTEPKGTYGSVAIDPENPENLKPDDKAVEEGIRFAGNKIKSESDEKTGAYLADNFHALGSNGQTAELAKNTMSNLSVAENVLNSANASAAQAINDVARDNINQMGQQAVQNGFADGVGGITGNPDSDISDFKAMTDADGNRHISFNAEDANGDTQGYEVYSGDQQSPDHNAIQTASGETWYVKRSDVSTSSFDVPPADSPSPSPSPSPSSGGGGSSAPSPTTNMSQSQQTTMPTEMQNQAPPRQVDMGGPTTSRSETISTGNEIPTTPQPRTIESDVKIQQIDLPTDGER